MNMLIRIGTREWLVVIFICVAASLFSSAKYVSQLLSRPPGHVFVGMIQYHEDFYYYLDQFYQGAHGGWLTYNNFTTENLPPTLIYFNHILLGKLFGLIGFTSFAAYNLSLLLLEPVFFLLCYLVLYLTFPGSRRLRIAAFLIFIFSTSLPEVVTASSRVLPEVKPMLMFRAKNTFFSRFGNIPGQYIERILFLILFLIISKTAAGLKNIRSSMEILSVKTMLISHRIPLFFMMVITGWLSLSNPVNALMFILVLMIVLVSVFRISKEGIKGSLIFFLPVCFTFILVSAYVSFTVNRDLVYKLANEWDLKEYREEFLYYNFPLFVKAIGLILPFFTIGLFRMVRVRLRMAEKLAVFISLFSLAGFYFTRFLPVPVPGFRFITAYSYLFMAVIAVNGMEFLEEISKRKILPYLLAGYLVVNSYTIAHSFMSEIKIPSEPTYHFTYIPNDIYYGLKYLSENTPRDAVVLASPNTSIDLMIPGITGRKTFTGHNLVTLRAGEKDEQARGFFYEWTDVDRARKFLTDNHIDYVIFTKYSGNFQYDELRKMYPFLREFYKNTAMVVYFYDKI